MSIIQNNYERLAFVLSRLQKTRDFPADELEQIVARVGKILQNLESETKRGFTPHTERLRNDLRDLLGNLQKELGDREAQCSKISRTSEAILRVQASLETAPLHAAKRPEETAKIGLKLAFFLDLDGPDHNGIILSGVKFALDQQVPFIATHSLLRCLGYPDSLKMRQAIESIEQKLLNGSADWEIYQGGEFIVFLPNSLLPDKAGAEKLRALDFSPDSMRKISLQELFQDPKGTPTIHGLFRLFNPQPSIDKLFYIDGHGTSHSIATLNAEHFQEFLTFLEQQRCRGLTIDSCYSGGVMSLQNLPVDEIDETKAPARFEDQLTHRPFPIFVRSIGDFHSKSEIRGEHAEDNLGLYLDEMGRFLEGPQQTIEAARRMLIKVERGLFKYSQSLVQVYFPPPAGVPGGFRPVGEKGTGFALTYVAAKKAERHPQRVKDKEFLEIHPLIIDGRLIFEGKDPVLLSMMPGPGHHFIKTLQLASKTLAAFMQQTISLHENWGGVANKGFFIGTVETEGKTYEQLVLFTSPTFSSFAYREGDDFFLSYRPITALEYALFCREVEESTRPSEAAIRSMSGGQEREELFRQTIKSSKFESPASIAAYQFLDQLRVLCDTQNDEAVLAFLEAQNFPRENQWAILFHLMKIRESVALKYLQNQKIDPNAKDYMAVPLICRAIEYGQYRIVEHLLSDREINLQVCHRLMGDNSPLHQALIKRDRHLLDLLSAHWDKINPQQPNASGWPAILYAFRFPDIFARLQREGSLNSQDSRGYTVLSFCTQLGVAVDFLLAAGADPNVGRPSALLQAIRKNSLDFVRSMMQAGGKPFDKDAEGTIPLVEAALRASPEMVTLILEEGQGHEEGMGHVNNVDYQGISPLLAALFSGNQEKISALKAKGARLPPELHWPAKLLLSHVLFRWCKLGQVDELRQFLQETRTTSPETHQYAVDYLRKLDPDLLAKLW